MITSQLSAESTNKLIKIILSWPYSTEAAKRMMEDNYVGSFMTKKEAGLEVLERKHPRLPYWLAKHVNTEGILDGGLSKNYFIFQGNIGGSVGTYHLFDGFTKLDYKKHGIFVYK